MMQPSTRLLWRTLLPRGAAPRASLRSTPKSASTLYSVSASTASFSSKSTPLSTSFSSSARALRVVSRRAFQQQNQRLSRRAYSSEPPKKEQGIKFWPFLVLLGLGFGGFTLLADNRAGTAPPASGNMPTLEPPKPAAGQIAAPGKSTPTFSPEAVTVLFVLGGPGAGKGTQCANLVKNHGFIHLSAGDLLRAEQERPGSQFGQLIKDYIKEGLIVPMEVTVQLLENAMAEAIRNDPKSATSHKFLIDGFPRKMDQAVKFEESVCPARLVLFYDCPEEEMERRLLERGKTSGRSDDNADSIRKRFRTFVETSMPVVDAFEKEGKVVKINATAPPAEVYKKTAEQLGKRLGDKF